MTCSKAYMNLRCLLVLGLQVSFIHSLIHSFIHSFIQQVLARAVLVENYVILTKSDIFLNPVKLTI